MQAAVQLQPCGHTLEGVAAWLEIINPELLFQFPVLSGTPTTWITPSKV
jgi:hypothetical protein